jgi:hypothetical protein
LENSNAFPRLENANRPQLQRQSNIENDETEEIENINENVFLVPDQPSDQTNKSKSAFRLVNSQNSTTFFDNTNTNQDEVETVNNPNVNNVNSNNSPIIASNSSVSKSPSVKSATYSSTSSASTSSVFLPNNTKINNTNVSNSNTALSPENERAINGQEYE